MLPHIDLGGKDKINIVRDNISNWKTLVVSFREELFCRI